MAAVVEAQERHAQPLQAAASLAWREIIRFFRQRNRVVGAVLQPLLFWGLFSVGLQRSFRVGEQDFGAYFFPGTLVLMVLFTAIFATISIIEDRREGFLQGVLVAPVPRWSIVLGKIVGGGTVAILQGLLLVALAWMCGVRPGPLNLAALALLLTITAFGLTGMGFVLAWRMESTQGFHAIMNLVLMPLWLLSGAFFPLPAWDERAGVGERVLHSMMRLDPLTYMVTGMRRLMYGSEVVEQAVADGFWSPQLSTCWLVSVGFLVLMFIASWLTANRPRRLAE